MIIKAVIFDSLFLYYDPERNRYHLCQTERSKSLPRRDLGLLSSISARR